MARRFVPVSRKINGLIVVTLVIGIGAISAYFGNRLSSTINEATIETLETNSEILYESIENLMLTGEAESAQTYFNNLATIDRDFEIRIYRANGEPAFVDNRGIAQVNLNLESAGMSLRFPPREEVVENLEPVDNEAFFEAAGLPAVSQTTFERDETGAYIRLFKPLINIPRCVTCHSPNHTVRGVIDIRSDISDSMRNRNLVWATTGGFFLLIVLVLAVVLPSFIRRIIIRPVRRIGEVCGAVTDGDFSQQVELAQQDEVGALGSTVNRMVQGLHERFELQKYVSSATLEQLTGDTAGESVELTLFFSDIRGFTSFTERNEPRTVIALLNEVLNFQTNVIIECGGDIDKYVGDEIVAVFRGPDGPAEAARCAVIIQDELSGSGTSTYGGLQVGVGIHNGRVILGMIGSQQRADFTVIGDNVNTASRYCSAAKPGEIVVSDKVANALGASARLEGPFRVTLKGKSAPQRVYKLQEMST